MKKLPPYKTWIEINKKAVENNIRVFRSILNKKTKLFAVVKSNAYGHGLEDFSLLADRFGVDGFCVDSVVEGQKLRKRNIMKPILVLGPTIQEFLVKEAAESNIAITVSNFSALEVLRKSKAVPDYHLKIDTGMHRQGFYVKDLPKVINLIKNSKLEIKNRFRGGYTHFAAAKDITYPDYTRYQIAQFNAAREKFIAAGFKNLVFHAAASGGTILYPEAHFDLVRIGIALYGYFPTKEAKIQHQLVWRKSLKLQPVLSWRAVVSEVKTLSAGDFIGYDLTEKIKKGTKVAVLPIGYWHGFPRSLSGIGEVLLDDKKSRVLGRVSMDLISVEGMAKVKVGHIATLIGKSGTKTITAEDFAEKCQSIHYEVLTRLNPLIKKEIV